MTKRIYKKSENYEHIGENSVLELRFLRKTSVLNMTCTGGVVSALIFNDNFVTNLL